MRRALLLLPALGAALLLAGCGQKGPLYLPDKNPRVVTTPAAPPPAPAASAPADEGPADKAPSEKAPAPPKPDDKTEAATPK